MENQLEKLLATEKELKRIASFSKEDMKRHMVNVHQERMGDWEVLNSGDLHNRKNGYYIHKHRLIEKDWFRHMMEKTWIDYSFFYAYFQACREAGITEITMNV